MISELWKQKNYLTPIPYLINNHIYEYDISKANINVLYSLKLIDEELYHKLYSMDRMDRQINIGYMLRNDPTLSDNLADGIAHFRNLFFGYNNIQDYEVLSIKNDAIFLINKIASVTKFDNVEFLLKNSYTSYLKLGTNLEIYYAYDRIENIFKFDVKGINDSLLELHADYMCSYIANLLMELEGGDIQAAINLASEYTTKYINRELDIGYYRTFDHESVFRINTSIANYSVSYITDINSVDISCNLEIMRNLYNYVSMIYFSRKSP